MEAVVVSKKYSLIIPENIRKTTGIKPGDKMLAIFHNGTIRLIPIKALKETEGFIPGINTQNLRDHSERLVY